MSPNLYFHHQQQFGIVLVVICSYVWHSNTFVHLQAISGIDISQHIYKCGKKELQKYQESNSNGCVGDSWQFLSITNI